MYIFGETHLKRNQPECNLLSQNGNGTGKQLESIAIFIIIFWLCKYLKIFIQRNIYNLDKFRNIKNVWPDKVGFVFFVEFEIRKFFKKS